MSNSRDLERYISAQGAGYPVALAEIKQGKKESHWMWYIFPQIKGLGCTETSDFYAIQDLNEAESFLNHPVLGSRLVKITNALLVPERNDASDIFGFPDDMKLKSSMTLFASLFNPNPVFHAVLEKFFSGKKDEETLRIMKYVMGATA